MHVKYHGLIQETSDHEENFSCIRCTSLITDNNTTDIQATPTQSQQFLSNNDQNPAIANNNETIKATPDPRSNSTPQLQDKKE